jgi:hypothetical protein
MTAQIMERLIIDGKEMRMAHEPLSIYLKNNDLGKELVSYSSACWRGYLGTWEIIDSKLYLVNLEATTTNLHKVGIDHFFPKKDKVFASWFTGEIRVPNGELLHYQHMGYMSVFEEDEFLNIENGVLINKRIIKNY